MKTLVLLFTLVLSAQTTVPIVGPDNLFAARTLRGHPRVFLDGTWSGTGGVGCPSTVGTAGYWSCRLKDPDGSGSGKSTYYDSYAAVAMRTRIGSVSPTQLKVWDADSVMFMGLMSYMCNQCTVPWDGAKSWGQAVKDILLNIDSIAYNNPDYPMVGLAIPGGGGGSAQSDYAAAAPLYFGMAYSATRDLWSTNERARFSALMLNGMPDEPCEPRWKVSGPLSGDLTINARTLTLTVETWPASVVAGATLYVASRARLALGNGIEWHPVKVVSVTDSHTIVGDYLFDFTTGGAYAIVQDFDATKHCGLLHFLSQRNDRPHYVYSFLSDSLAPLGPTERVYSLAQTSPCATGMALCTYSWVPGDVREQTIRLSTTVKPKRYLYVDGVTSEDYPDPTSSAPWWMLIWHDNQFDWNTGVELLRVTGRTATAGGDIYTVQRGEYSYPLDIPDHAGRAYGNVVIFTKGMKYANYEYGLDNRQLWGSLGLTGMGIALADDDPKTITYQGQTVTRAAALASLAGSYFKAQTYDSARDEFTLFTTGALTYGNGRTMVGSHHQAFVLSNSFDNLDFADYAHQGAQSFIVGQSEFHPWWHAPWDLRHGMRWGQTPTASGVSYGQDVAPLSLAQIGGCTNTWMMYPGSEAAKKCYYDLKTYWSDGTTSAWDAWFPSGGPAIQGYWSENMPILAMLLSNYPNGWSTTNITTGASSKIWASGVTGVTDSITGTKKGQKMFSSKTDWTSGATGLWGSFPDSVSDKFPYVYGNEPQSGWSLGKNGWLLQSEMGYVYPEIDVAVEQGEAYLAQNSVAFVGGNLLSPTNAYPLFDKSSTTPIVRKALSGTSRVTHFHAMADLKNDFMLGHGSGIYGNDVTRMFRHWAHFKAGKEFIITYSDVATGAHTPSGQQPVEILHYSNNGETPYYLPNTDRASSQFIAEGTSALDSSVTLMRSNTGTAGKANGLGGSEVITRWLTPTAGADPWVTDLSVKQSMRGSENEFTLGYDCSASYPCRASFGGNQYSYTTPVKFTVAGQSISCCTLQYVRVYIDTDGAAKIRKDSTVTITFTSGSVPVSDGDWPAGVIKLASLWTDWGGSPRGGTCPGGSTPGWYGGSDMGGPPGCSGYYEAAFPSSTRGTARQLMISPGTTTSAEIIAVHRPTSTLGETMPSIQAVSGGSNYEGVAVMDSSDPAIAMFPRDNYVGTGVSFTAPASAAAYRVMVAGLQGGATYTVNGSGSYLVPTGEETLYLTDVAAGAVAVAQSGTSAPLAIATPACATAQTNVAYSCSMEVSGGVTPYASCSMHSGTLPTGLSVALVGSSCVISGTPTGTTATGLSVRATDASAATVDSSSFTLTVSSGTPPLTWVTSSLPGGTVSMAYLQTVSCTNGAGAITYNHTSGSLPTGLSLSSSGAITGTPSAAGAYSFTLTCTDGSSSPSQNLSISISPEAASLVITASPASATWGTAASHASAVTATGGTDPYTYTASGLPDGLSLASNGTLSGTSYAQPGVYTATATATDSAAASVQSQWAITVAPASAGTLSLHSVGVGNTAALLYLGRTGQARGAACRIYVSRGGSVVATASPSLSYAAGIIPIYGLTQGMQYDAQAVCGGHSSPPISITTATLSATRTVRLRFGAVSGAASISVAWTQDGITQTAATGACSGSCSALLTAARGSLVAYTVSYKSAGGSTIASATNNLIVP